MESRRSTPLNNGLLSSFETLNKSFTASSEHRREKYRFSTFRKRSGRKCTFKYGCTKKKREARNPSGSRSSLSAFSLPAVCNKQRAEGEQNTCHNDT